MEKEKGKEVVIDIESQKNIEEKKGNTNSGGNKRPNKSLSKYSSGKLGYNGASKKGKMSSNTTHSEVMIDTSTMETQNEESVVFVENTQRKEKRKVKNSNKPTKPPRPPNSSALINASDLKLAKELYEIKEKKRARMRRIRAISNTRAEKSGSSAITYTSLIVSIIFFLVIFIEVYHSGSTPYITIDKSSQPLPEQNGLISVKFPNLASKKNVAVKSITSSLAKVPQWVQFTR